MEEIDQVEHQDKALWVIESLDSHWLEKEIQKMKRRNKMRH